MGLQITVAGTDRTAACQVKAIRITGTIEANGNLMDLEISTTGNWRPQAANEVIVSTTSDAVRHFAGHVIDLEERAVSRSQLHYALTCRDYTWLFDRRMVTTNYAAQAASAIIASIITTYTTGFSTAGINVAPAVAAQRYDYVAPSQAIQQLADNLQWHFYINYSKVPQFFAAITDIAPTTGINFDTETVNYGNLRLKESAANTRNRVILQGYQTKGTNLFSRSFTGDSTTRFFYMGYSPAGVSTGDITVTVDGVAVDMLTDTVDGAAGSTVGSSSQAFVCFDNYGVRFSTAGAAPSSSVVIQFYPMNPGGVQWDDAAAQTDMAARSSGDGVHMFMWNDPQLTNYANNDDLALARASALTERYGSPSLEGDFTSYLDGWRAGQYFTGVSAFRMGGFTKTFYVNRVTKELAEHRSGGSPVWTHKVEISDSPLSL